MLIDDGQAKELAAAVLNYALAIEKGQDDPATMTSLRTMQGDDLDGAFERMYEAACEILEVSPQAPPSAFEVLIRGFAVEAG